MGQLLFIFLGNLKLSRNANIYVFISPGAEIIYRDGASEKF